MRAPGGWRRHTAECKTEFLRLTQFEADLNPDLRAFPSRAYNLKAVADYETGP